MTAAWYGHLKIKSLPIKVAIFASWGIAFFEYCLQVPANRIGHRVLSAYQLKIIQECVTLGVFVVFSWLWLGEKITPRYALSFALIFAAIAIAFKK
jgi:uncharacterized protein (DUF486 family)